MKVFQFPLLLLCLNKKPTKVLHCLLQLYLDANLTNCTPMMDFFLYVTSQDNKKTILGKLCLWSRPSIKRTHLIPQNKKHSHSVSAHFFLINVLLICFLSLDLEGQTNKHPYSFVCWWIKGVTNTHPFFVTDDCYSSQKLHQPDQHSVAA